MEELNKIQKLENIVVKAVTDIEGITREDLMKSGFEANNVITSKSQVQFDINLPHRRGLNRAVKLQEVLITYKQELKEVLSFNINTIEVTADGGRFIVVCK